MQVHQTRLERSNEELDRFAHLVGHDLKAPLNSISGLAQILVMEYEDALDDEGNRLLQELPKQCTRLANLIDSLVQFSSVQQVELAVRTVPLDELVDDVLQLLDPVVRDRGAVIERHPLPVVTCDAVRVREVLMNLVTNALKYNEGDAPRIEIGTRALRDGQATVYVRDDGIGIAPAHHEKIFGMLERLHAKDAYGGGSGSGLALASIIVERHGGRIEVESKLGEGSTFLVTLPGAESGLSAA